MQNQVPRVVQVSIFTGHVDHWQRVSLLVLCSYPDGSSLCRHILLIQYHPEAEEANHQTKDLHIALLKREIGPMSLPDHSSLLKRRVGVIPFEGAIKIQMQSLGMSAGILSSLLAGKLERDK